MPLFMCSQCGVIENTALSGYWQQRFSAGILKESFRPQCSKCATGVWHGQFERKLAIGFLQDGNGHIYRQEEASGYFKHMGPFKTVVLPDTAIVPSDQGETR